MVPEMFTIGPQDAAVDGYSLGCSYIELFSEKSMTSWHVLSTDNAKDFWVF